MFCYIYTVWTENLIWPYIKYQKAKIILEKLGYKSLDTSYSKTQKKLKSRETEITFSKIINGVPIYFDEMRIPEIRDLSHLPNCSDKPIVKVSADITLKLDGKHYVAMVNRIYGVSTRAKPCPPIMIDPGYFYTPDQGSKIGR